MSVFIVTLQVSVPDHDESDADDFEEYWDQMYPGNYDWNYLVNGHVDEEGNPFIETPVVLIDVSNIENRRVH